MNSSAALLDKSAAPTRIRYVVLFALCLAATLAYIDRGCLSVAESSVRADLGLRKSQTGWLLSGFAITYTLFQLPAGWLAHVCGTRRALPCFAILWSLATGLGALALGFPMLLLSRLGMGAAEAGIFPCATSTLAKWFPSTRRALVCGVMGSFMGVGGAIGAAATGELLTVFSWRWVFVAYALPGLLWAVWFYLWFRDHPRQHRGVNAAELDIIQGPDTDEVDVAKDERPSATPWLAMCTSLPLAWLCGQQFFRAFAQAFYQTWFPTFLQESRGVSVQEAGLLTSYPHWAMVVGSVTGGLLSDWLVVSTGSRWIGRQGLSIAGLTACALLVLVALSVAQDWLFIMFISLSTFVASLAGPAAYAACIDLGGRHVAPVFSMMNMAGNVGAFLFPIVVGDLVEVDPQNWNLVLLGVAALHIGAALCWLLFRPKRAVGA